MVQGRPARQTSLSMRSIRSSGLTIAMVLPRRCRLSCLLSCLCSALCRSFSWEGGFITDEHLFYTPAPNYSDLHYFNSGRAHPALSPAFRALYCVAGRDDYATDSAQSQEFGLGSFC